MNVTLLRANRLRSDRGNSLTVYHQYTIPSARCQSLRMIFPKANAALRINSAGRHFIAETNYFFLRRRRTNAVTPPAATTTHAMTMPAMAPPVSPVGSSAGLEGSLGPLGCEGPEGSLGSEGPEGSAALPVAVSS